MMSKRLLLPVLSLALFLGTLEIGLRIMGQGVLAEEEKNEIHPGDDGAIRIVAVGDSITADDPKVPPWPRRLEQKLSESGIHARVYNLARGAATTSSVMDRLPEQLDYFRPQIVVSMIGRMDTQARLVPLHSSWIDDLRIVKLYRWVFLLNARRRTDQQTKELAPMDFGGPGATSEIITKLKSNEPGSAEPVIVEQIGNLNATDRARYFLYLTNAVGKVPFFHDIPNAGIRIDLLKRSLAARFQMEVASSLAFHFSDSGREDECLALAKQIVGHGWIGDDEAVTAFSGCAGFSWKTASKRRNEWPDVLRKLSGGHVDPEFLDRGELLTKNYRALHRLLEPRKIIHIAMQYPTLSIEELKDYFRSAKPRAEIDPQFRDILFVDNQRNFSAELAKHPYDDLFVDSFGDTFGHTTDLGQSVITEAVYPVVLEAIGHLSKPVTAQAR